VVDLGPRYAVANPFGFHLSGLPAKAVTRGYHLAALPYNANRFSVAVDWLSDLVTPRPAIRLGLVDPASASFAVSEHRPDLYPADLPDVPGV
jgi:NADH dehydrogenase